MVIHEVAMPHRFFIGDIVHLPFLAYVVAGSDYEEANRLWLSLNFQGVIFEIDEQPDGSGRGPYYRMMRPDEGNYRGEDWYAYGDQLAHGLRPA